MIEKPTEAEAQKLLTWVASLDPSWTEKIQAVKEERHSNALNTIAILVCNTLETETYLETPILPQLQDDFVPAGQTAECRGCGNSYVLAYPGQPACGPDCAAFLRGEAPKPLPTARQQQHITVAEVEQRNPPAFEEQPVT